MIRRSLLVFVLLVIVYAAYIAFLKPELNTAQHQASGNRISAEQFLFSPHVTGSTVIVGSSLAFRIELDSLAPHTSNLSFGGLSVHDGLELVRRSGKKPARVVIETNMLFKEKDRGFLEALFQPGLYEMRKVAPILREENQPTGVLVGMIKKRMKNTEDPASAEPDSMSMSENLFDTNRGIFAKVPADSTQQRFLGMLKHEVQALEARGVQVLFMEVPISAELMTSPLAVRTRETVAQQFPNHHFIRSDRTWRTTDGLHLEWHNAQRYSRWLAKELDAP